jgi:hypothetical protein
MISKRDKLFELRQPVGDLEEDVNRSREPDRNVLESLKPLMADTFTDASAARRALRVAYDNGDAQSVRLIANAMRKQLRQATPAQLARYWAHYEALNY